MKKIMLFIAIAVMVPFTNMYAQTYNNLWKQVDDAVDKDLPKTEQQLLRQIAEKAVKEKAFGQLLKAELQEARSLTSVSLDSLEPAVERLKLREAQANDVALKAIYNAVLGYIYQNNKSLDIDNYQQIAADYYNKALSDPAKLAAVKSSIYEPFVVNGIDSKFFDHDLLSVIGYETQQFQDQQPSRSTSHQSGGYQTGTSRRTGGVQQVCLPAAPRLPHQGICRLG